MKRLTLFVLFFLCVKILNVSAFSAQSAVLLDAQTGRILYEKNAFSEKTMASTTKIMTAILALEYQNTDEIVTVSANAAGQEGSSMYLAAGQKISLYELICGLMMVSGNDAAVAIAEHISGDVTSFAQKMTQKAKEIGANNTSFKNPNGLDEKGHYTTAYDLALIARYCMQNPVFCEIVSKSKIEVNSNTYYNHNKLLYKYPYCTGIKTGYTKKSGRCLVSSATKDGFSVIAVTLSAPDDWNDHIYLFDYAFNNYKPRNIITENQTIKEITVKNGETEKINAVYKNSFSMNLTDDEQVDIKINCPEYIDAPVEKGQKLGTARIEKDGTIFTEIDIVAQEESKEKIFNQFFENLTKIVITWLCQVKST